MNLAQGKHNGLAVLTADGIANHVFEKCFGEKLIGCGGEELLFELSGS